MPKIGDVIPITPDLVPLLTSINAERKNAYDALTDAQAMVSLVERKFFKTVYEGMPEMKGCAFIYDQERGNLIVASTDNVELTKSVEG